MTTNWTDLDPGAGDLSSCDTAKQWTDAQLGDLDNAEATVSGILRELDDSWTGDSADSFRARLEQFRSRLEDSIEAMQTAGKAIVVYGDIVADIAGQAEPLKDDLATAKATLSDVINGPTKGSDAQARLDIEKQALSDGNAAAAALRALAVRRMDADNVLATALATSASIAWGGLDCTVDPITGTLRDATNRRVMDLFDHFRTGDERGAVLTDDDLFVQKLMTSDHIKSVRERILADLRSGELNPNSPGAYNRVISDDLTILFKDVHTIPTLPLTGTLPNDLLEGQNMPETFLGSYVLEVRAGEPRPDGGVDVTYVINNDTSIDSFTRIPGTGGAHIPGPYEVMTEANARNGEWATHHQTIVWTETVYP